MTGSKKTTKLCIRTDNSLDQIQDFFNGLFSKKNLETKKKKYSNNQISFVKGHINSHIIQDLGNLAEKIRESEKKDIVRYINSIFAWSFGFSNEMGFKLSKSLWTKYPGFCPYCGDIKDCADAWWTSKQTSKGKKPTPKIRAGLTPIAIPRTLDAWISMWDNIYGRKYRIGMSISDIMYKLYEENAEVLEALEDLENKKAGAKNELQVELADFVSWMFALILKLDSYGFLKKDETAKNLAAKFEKGCIVCEKQPCRCPVKINEKNSK